MEAVAGDRPAAEAGAPPPLSPAACVVLVRLVLDAAAAADESRGGLVAEFRRHGGVDAAAAVWLERLDRESSGREAAHATLVERLAAGFEVTGGTAATMPERGALEGAVAAATAARAARDGFAAAVAAARLEALREFAYGAGHEINNPLANIATRAQSLLLDERSPERRRRLAVIVDQAFRGRDMIGGLMVFARPPKPTAAAVPVDRILTAVLHAVKQQAATHGARLECSPPPAPLPVLVDEAHVTEALRLVTVNAIEAVAAGGRVTLAAKRRDGAGTATACEVVVTDDGAGMDADTLRRAFDPFFSGREAGRGIGLGLPKAWRLVEINGGEIGVESVPGRGTRVTILLPLADPAR